MHRRGYPVVINPIGPFPTTPGGYPIRGIVPPVGLSNTKVGYVQYEYFASLIIRSILKDRGYPIGNTNRANYRYARNAIPSPIPHFTPTTSGVITGMGVTQLLALYSSLYSYNVGCYPIGYAYREEYPRDRMPAGWGTPIEWRYPIRFYHNPTFPIYTTMSSFLQVRDLT